MMKAANFAGAMSVSNGADINLAQGSSFAPRKLRRRFRLRKSEEERAPREAFATAKRVATETETEKGESFDQFLSLSLSHLQARTKLENPSDCVGLSNGSEPSYWFGLSKIGLASEPQRHNLTALLAECTCIKLNLGRSLSLSFFSLSYSSRK